MGSIKKGRGKRPFLMLLPREARRKSTRSVPSRQGHRRKAEKFLPYFLYLTKSRKKLLLGRAKSCRWQVFVRRRPPKQGELRTDVSKATMFQGDGEALRPTIQSSAGSDFAETFGGFCRNRFCPQNAGEKALNRCERVTAVQTQD